MKQVTIHEAKTHLSRLIQAALKGEEIIIAKGNKPVVRLDVLPEARLDRHIGGQPDLLITMAEDFNEPLEDFSEYMQ
ncbi:MAG: type II toxin-antitoxin system prevent-host-death family antitoxin [Xanthomonadales bacterium]